MPEFIGTIKNNHISIQEIQDEIPNNKNTTPSESTSSENNANKQNLSTDIDERFVVHFDGIIYNEANLWNLLTKTSDPLTEHPTETLIASLFMEKGTHMFSLLRGKFAIIIWDTQESVLYGARDQFGIKPLYFLDIEEEC